MQQLPKGEAQSPPMNGHGARIVTAIRRYLLLEHKVTDAAEKSYGPGTPGWDEFRFGRAAALDAQILGESSVGLCSATLLSRTAIILLIRAHLVRLGITADITQAASADWARLLEQPDSARLKQAVTQQQFDQVASVLGADGNQFLFQQPIAQLRTTLSELTNVARILLIPLENNARRATRLIIWRWLQLALVLTIIVIGVSALWRSLVKHPNLALNKSVSIQTSGAEWGRDPKGLVDGNKAELGFHTIEGANQNATIDLGRVQTVSRVVVYNRVECCQERAVPLRIEVANDGKHYRKVAERDEPFGLTWTADFPSTKARYIRLTNLNTTYFHLTEVEVY